MLSQELKQKIDNIYIEQLKTKALELLPNINEAIKLYEDITDFNIRQSVNEINSKIYLSNYLLTLNLFDRKNKQVNYADLIDELIYIQDSCQVKNILKDIVHEFMEGYSGIIINW